jgi:uncharacterized iron-regulated membrane protein
VDPRSWAASQLRAITVFRSGLRGRARDFNWHNVIGIWSVVPLVLIVVECLADVVSVGQCGSVSGGGRSAADRWRGWRAASRRADAGGRGARRGRESRSVEAASRADASGQTLNALWKQAERQVDDWRSISLRLPNDATAPLTFTIDRGMGGQPQLRGTLTIDRATGNVVRWETFDTQTTGRRLRTFTRFAHTGEFFGVAGQTIAGLASAGAVVLTWTGLSLALRRLSSWRKRRRDRTVVVAQTSAA